MSNVLLGNLQQRARESESDAVAGLRIVAKPEKQPVQYFAIVIDLMILVALAGITVGASGIFAEIHGSKHSAIWCATILALLPLNALFAQYSQLQVPILSHLLRHMGAALCALVFGSLVAAVAHINILREFAAASVVFISASLIARECLDRSLARYRSNPFRVDYVVTVGEGPLVESIEERLDASRVQLKKVVERFTIEKGCSSQILMGASSRIHLDKLVEYLSHHPADIVIFALSQVDLLECKDLVDSILEMGLAVCVLPTSFGNELIERRDDLVVSEGYSGIEMIALRTVSQSRAYLVTKRLIDIVLSAMALILLSPLFLLIAVLVKATSEGPVFYPWEVLGRNRKPFTGYKFRTMVRNADEIKQELMKFNEMTGPVFKMRNDPRITAVGRWLRKFSLDEIPQFYSVFKGDMSLVGPRPPSQSESDRFKLWQHRKLSVKPGITCLWQVNGRTEIADFAKWAELDIQYIRGASLSLDLKILLKTIPVVLFGHGAY